MSDEGRNRMSDQVRVAGIQSRTAIAVALIGVISTVGGVLVTSWIKTAQYDREMAAAPRQDWLRIRGIEGLEGVRVRVVVHVDDVVFAYPTLTAWVVPGPDVTEAAFPLPISTEPHRVRFTAEALDAEVDGFLSQEVDVVEAGQNEHVYEVVATSFGGVDGGGWGAGSVRGVEARSIGKLRIRYAITPD